MGRAVAARLADTSRRARASCSTDGRGLQRNCPLSWNAKTTDDVPGGVPAAGARGPPRAGMCPAPRRTEARRAARVTSASSRKVCICEARVPAIRNAKRRPSWAGSRGKTFAAARP